MERLFYMISDIFQNVSSPIPSYAWKQKLFSRARKRMKGRQTFFLTRVPPVYIISCFFCPLGIHNSERVCYLQSVFRPSVVQDYNQSMRHKNSLYQTIVFLAKGWLLPSFHALWFVGHIIKGNHCTFTSYKNWSGFPYSSCGLQLTLWVF